MVCARNSPLRAAAAQRLSAFRRLSQIVAGAVGDSKASFAVAQGLGAGDRYLR
jgi:hypothetical protein